MTKNIPTSDRIVRILLLEDEPRDAKLILHTLEKSGLKFECTVVSSSSDFITRVQFEPFDIILGDFNLPDWTGLDAVRWLRSADYVVPFILVSGTLGDDVAVNCIKEGATDYVLKDRLERLPASIRRALEETRIRLERDKAESELRESAAQYRLLFESNPNPMWVYDTESLRFLAVNRAAEQHYGYSARQFLSMTILEIRPPEDRTQFLAEYHAWDRTSDIDYGVWRHTHKDGREMDVEISSRSIEFQKCKARLVLAVDITSRLQAQKALERSEVEHRSLIDGSPYGIYLVNQEGQILMANPALITMLGYQSEKEVLGLDTKTDFYCRPEDRQRAIDKFTDSIFIKDYEANWKRKDGKEICVRLGGRMVIPEAGQLQIYEVFVQDITEEKLLQQQLQQAQKIEAIGRLAGGVAHDFNNMLMIIDSYTELLDGAKDDLEKQKQYRTHIRDAVKKAAAITKQLLAFSRKQVLEPTVLDLNVLIAEIGKMLPRLLGEDIEMVIEGEANLGSVSADKSQIEQVIVNLAVNASDAMPAGGRLIIETSKVTLDGDYAQAHGIPIISGNYVMIAVTDTGIGMDAKTQAQIFEPFFTTKEQGEGTGLGLATVYGIVKQSGGFIWVYSEVGRGTTFKVYLPRVDATRGLITPLEPMESFQGSNETILIVEDEPALRDAASDYLQSSGYNTLSASNGNVALELIKNHSGPIHVLITDVVMPKMGGPVLVEAAMRVRPELKVIYVSGYTDRSINPQMLGARVIFMQKPFSLGALAKRIRILLGTS